MHDVRTEGGGEQEMPDWRTNSINNLGIGEGEGSKNKKKNNVADFISGDWMESFNESRVAAAADREGRPLLTRERRPTDLLGTIIYACLEYCPMPNSANQKYRLRRAQKQLCNLRY